MDPARRVWLRWPLLAWRPPAVRWRGGHGSMGGMGAPFLLFFFSGDVRQVLGWEHRFGAVGVTATGPPVSRLSTRPEASRWRGGGRGGGGCTGTRSAALRYVATFPRAEVSVLPSSKGRARRGAARRGEGRRRPCRYRAGGGGGAGRQYGAGGVRRRRAPPPAPGGMGEPAARPRRFGERGCFRRDPGGGARRRWARSRPCRRRRRSW